MPGDADPFGLLASLRDLRTFIARPLETGYDALDALVSVCRNTVPAVDAAAISYAGHGQVRSTHVTDPAIDVIDRWHNQTGAGPLSTGIKFFNWIGTMWRGLLTFESPMLFAVGFLVTFLLGGLTGRSCWRAHRWTSTSTTSTSWSRTSTTCSSAPSCSRPTPASTSGSRR